MRHAAWIIAVALAMSVGVGGAYTPPPALATKADELEQARALIEAARPFVKQADNTDLPNGERKKGRKGAYKRLKQARRLYDAYIDGHPGEMEALDAEYCECASMLYWVKKMASINEFDSSDEVPVELPTTEKKDAGSSGGGIGGATRPGDPEDGGSGGGGGKGDDPPEDTGGGAEEETAPPPEDPQQALARRAAEVLAAIEEEERGNPGDVPRLHALYEKFLVEFPDPSLPQYMTAALRLGALSDRMKTVFKETVGSDPDALKNADSAEITRVVATLGKLMKAREPEERRTAARLLGACGSGSASIYLVRGIRDKDDEVRALSAKGLVAIGGTRVANNLVKTYRDSKHEAQMSAVDVLEQIAAKSPVDARIMSYHLGRFLLSRDQEVAGRCLDVLEGMGSAGGPGLIEGLDTRMILKKIEVIKAIGRAKYYQGAWRVSFFLLQGDNRKTVVCRNAAREALKHMGKPVIPYLIANLKDRRVRLHTAMVMNEIAGVRYGANDVKEWREWCEENGFSVDEK